MDLLKLFEKSKDLNLICKVSESLKDLKEFSKETDQFVIETNELMEKWEMKAFEDPIQYEFDVPVSKLILDYSHSLLKEIPTLLIHFKKEAQNNSISVFASLSEESKDRIIWELRLSNDWFCKIENNFVTTICKKSKLIKIGELELEGDIKNYNSEKLSFLLYLIVLDDKIYKQIKIAEDLLIERIVQNMNKDENSEHIIIFDDDDENKRKENFYEEIQEKKK